VSDFNLDWQREARTGVAEAVLCEPKTPAQIAAILDAAVARGARLLLTRLAPAQHDALPGALREQLDFDPLSRTAILGALPPGKPIDGALIVAAGTADLVPAREAARTLAFHGRAAPLIADVGVAGLWRLTEQLGRLREARVLIVAAGMEGALFSVVAGLVAAPVVAVPTSTGYGSSFGGLTALLAMLNSCASNVSVVNIDNGFGAGRVASAINRA